MDKRKFKFLKLPNELVCLLVSDLECDIAAASLDVDVGSLHSFEDRDGLAHFLEHMLFMGSKKFPDEKGYKEFI